MRIRPKLVLLVLGITVLMSLGTALIIFSNDSSHRMETEKNALNSLSASFEGLAVAVNRVPFETFGSKLDSLQKAKETIQASFADLDQIEVIPLISADVKTALEAVRSLKELADQRLASMEEAYKVVAADAGQVFLFTKNQRILDFFTYDFAPDKKKFLTETALKDVAAEIKAIETMHDTLARSIQTIQDQYQIIDSAVADAQAASATWTAILVVVILVLTLGGSLVLARGIARAIVAIAKSIASLKDGDLTGRSKVRRKDEIGTLSSNLNLFMDSMTESLRQIQEVSNRNLVLKNSLADSTTEAEVAITEIGANTVSIGDQIRTLDGRIAVSAQEIEGVAGTISELNDLIVRQRTVNKQSSASVMGMVGSLEKLREMTQQDLTSVVELVRISEQGRLVFDEATVKMAEIPRSIETILEMASVIDNLAAQTNLLAMNAAIEAAHAGNAGRGFAVVAEEIRKLAEASTASSRHISESIKTVVATIDEASRANQEARTSFDSIEGKIHEVSSSLEQIQGSLSTIHNSSQEVLSTLAEQDSRAEDVGNSSVSVGESSQKLKAIMSDVSRISSEVTLNIAEITIGIQSVGAAVTRVSQISLESGEGSASLDREVHRFTLEAPSGVEATSPASKSP